MSKEPPKFTPERCGICGSTRNTLNGAWFRWARKERGISLRKFAQLAGYSAAYVSDVELGRRHVSVSIELAYAKVLKVKP